MGLKSSSTHVVDLTDLGELRKYPFLFMTSEYHYTLSEGKKKNLKKYLEEGGFLMMDDCVYGPTGDYFYQSSYKLLEEIFEAGSVKKIPYEHEIFHNVYDFGGDGPPRLWGQNHGAHGVFIGDRLAVFLSSTDIHCGWAHCTGWNERQNQDADRIGINIVSYVMSH